MEMFLTIKLCTYAKLFICIKMDMALNNLQWLICHKTQTNSLDLILMKLSKGTKKCNFHVF